MLAKCAGSTTLRYPGSDSTAERTKRYDTKKNEKNAVMTTFVTEVDATLYGSRGFIPQYHPINQQTVHCPLIKNPDMNSLLICKGGTPYGTLDLSPNSVVYNRAVLTSIGWYRCT